MIDMAVSNDDGFDFELVLIQDFSDFGNFVARIDNDRFARLFVAEDGAVAAELADGQNEVDLCTDLS